MRHRRSGTGPSIFIRFFSFFLRNRIVSKVVIISAFLLGGYSLFRLRRENMPRIDSDRMLITIVRNGYSSRDLEMSSVIPVEEKLSDIRGIKEYSSVIYEGGARIDVRLDEDARPAEKTKDDIYREITRGNIPDLPSDLDRLSVKEIEYDSKPVYLFALREENKEGSGNPEQNPFLLNDVARNMREALKRLPGVSGAETIGYEDPVVYIKVDHRKARARFISLDEIIRSIRNRNIRSTGGTLQSLSAEETILTIGEFENFREVGDVIVRSNFNDEKIRVKDLALIRKKPDEQIKTRVHTNNRKSIIFIVSKKGNRDIIRTVKEIKTFLKNSSLRPPSVRIQEIWDEGKEVEAPLKVMIGNILLGIVLIILILIIFLDMRTALWTSFGLPFSILLTFFVLYITGNTINSVSLVAMIIVVGMLVDHGIVIAEIIYEKQKRRSSRSGEEIAAEGVQEIIAPVFMTILTTIFSFVPLLLIRGLLGKLSKVIPLVVVSALLISFFEAVFILPGHIARRHSGSSSKPRKKNRRNRWFRSWIRAYQGILKIFLRFRKTFFILFLLAVSGGIFLSFAPFRNFVFFWDGAVSKIDIVLTVPEGMPIEEHEAAASRVEKAILKAVPSSLRLSLTGEIRPWGEEGEEKEKTRLKLYLVPQEERDISAYALVRALKKQLKPENFPPIKQISVGVDTTVFGGKPISVRLIGDDIETLKKKSLEMETFLKSVPGVTDVKNSLDQKNREIYFRFDFEKMARYGVSVGDVARTVRAAYNGIEAGSRRTLRGKLSFVVKMDDDFRKDPKTLLELYVPTPAGRLIQLKQIARLQRREGLPVIRHYNGNRYASLTAGADQDRTTPLIVIKKIKDRFGKEIKRNPYLFMTFGGEAETTADLIRDLGAAFLIAVVLIFLSIAFLFESFLQPLLVLVPIPLGFLGALMSLTLHGAPLSSLGGIGLVGLAGVIVNDSLIMVDFLNKLVRDYPNQSGSRILPLIIKGAGKRFRPILLTTVSTVCGLIPTIYGIGGEAGWLKPAVIVLAYGLIAATLGTLFFLPAVYLLLYDIKYAFRSLFRGRKEKLLSRRP